MYANQERDENTKLKPYRLCAEELSVNQTGDLVLKGSKIVIPKALKDRATKLRHGGHQGIEKTKALLREKIWYLGMDYKVKEMIESCVACQAVGAIIRQKQCESRPQQPSHGKV